MSNATDTIKSDIRNTIRRGASINALQNEGGDGYDHTNNAELSESYAQLKSATADEWTIETTTQRRAAWNDAVRTVAANGERVTPKTISDKTGICYRDLLAAVKRLNLSA